VRVSKLAQILPTSTLDCIFDDSGEKNSLAGPHRPLRSAKNIRKHKKYNFHPRYATLGPYCCPMGGLGMPNFLFLDF